MLMNDCKSFELNFPRITFFSSMAVFCCNTKLVEKSPFLQLLRYLYKFGGVYKHLFELMKNHQHVRFNLRILHSSLMVEAVLYILHTNGIAAPFCFFLLLIVISCLSFCGMTLCNPLRIERAMNRKL